MADESPSGTPAAPSAESLTARENQVVAVALLCLKTGPPEVSF